MNGCAKRRDAIEHWNLRLVEEVRPPSRQVNDGVLYSLGGPRCESLPCNCCAVQNTLPEGSMRLGERVERGGRVQHQDSARNTGSQSIKLPPPLIHVRECRVRTVPYCANHVGVAVGVDRAVLAENLRIVASLIDERRPNESLDICKIDRSKRKLGWPRSSRREAVSFEQANQASAKKAMMHAPQPQALRSNRNPVADTIRDHYYHKRSVS